MAKSSSAPETVKLFCGDSLDVLATLPESSVDSIVCDPPYGIRFMGVHKWDYDVPSIELWQQVLRVLKPGGHLLAFGGCRTYHRMVVNIEDAGFEIRDQLQWIFGSGFPKSHDISKAIDKSVGEVREVISHTGNKNPQVVNRNALDYGGSTGKAKNGLKDGFDITVPATESAKQWEGWGTALKPSNEPIIWAKKPLTVVPVNVILQVQSIIGVLVCLSLSSVKYAESLLKLSLVEQSKGVVSARLLAALDHINGSDAQLEKTAMFKSPETAKIILNIAELWRTILNINYAKQNTFTTSTAIELTTELKILVSLISPIIQDIITPEGMRLLGEQLTVNTAVKSLNVSAVKCSNITSVQELATLLMGQSNASNVEQNFTLAAHLANTVLRGAIINLDEKIRPANEPIVLARKPLSEKNIAANVLAHGTGGINIDGCKIELDEKAKSMLGKAKQRTNKKDDIHHKYSEEQRVDIDAPIDTFKESGRWPANVIMDSEAGAMLDEQSGVLTSGAIEAHQKIKESQSVAMSGKNYARTSNGFPASSGGASRFFYCAKVSKAERNAGLPEGMENKHPTLKPVALMRYLCRLVTPPNGTVLDPFMGSGSTGIAAKQEEFHFIGIEREREFYEIATARIENCDMREQKEFDL